MSVTLDPRTESDSPKRHAVLDAAATLFMAQGYGAVSMDSIAREAGVSKATLYAHFTSKDRLFATIITEACQSKIGRFPELGAAFYDSGPAQFLLFFSAWLGAQMQSGRLRAADPEVAADQFIALIRSGIYMRASVGLPVKQDEATVQQHVANAVDTFLRAFGPER